MARLGSYGWLLATLVASLFVQGTLPPSGAQQILVSILLGANLVLAAVVARVHPNWLRLAAWLVIGLVFYFGYARSHSRLAAEQQVTS